MKGAEIPSGAGASGGVGASRLGRILPALIVAAIALVYGQTLRYDFVNYDDYDLIVGNTAYLEDPGNILTSFTTHAFSTHREEGVYYRPVLLLTYILDYQLWRLNPGGYHFTNLLLHALASLFLFLLIVEIAGGYGGDAGSGRQSEGGKISAGSGGGTAENRPLVAAFFGSLLFALHPVQTEAVAWVAGRNDVLLGLFVILFLYFYVRSSPPDGGNGRRYLFPAAVVCYAMALLTKEPAVFFVILVPLYELTIGKKTGVALFSGATYRKMVVLAVVTGAYLAVRYAIFGAFVGSEDLYGKIPLENRFLMAPGLLTKNFVFLLWPFSQNIAHPIENVIWFEGVYLAGAIAVMCGLIATAVHLFRRSPRFSWSVLWILTGMVPLLNIFPLAVPILEHRLYTTVAGAGLVLALLFEKMDRAERMPAVAVLVPGLLCIPLAVLSFLRLPVWADSGALWSDAIAKEPGSARAHFNLAGHYFELQQYDSTVVLLEKYVELRPEDMLGFAKLRQSYFLTGKIPEAAAVCRKMIDLTPESVNRYLEAGLLYERIGLSDSVISIYEEGISANPDFYQLQQKLGEWYDGQGNLGKARLYYGAAIETLETLGRQSPLSNEQTTLLARMYSATNQPEKVDSLSRAGRGAVRL